MLAVYLSFRNMPSGPAPRYGEGAAIGALAGAIGSILTFLIGAMVVVSMFGMLGLTAMFDSSAEELEYMSLMMFGLSFAVVAIVVLSIVLNILFSILGGILGAAVMHRRPSAPEE